MPFDSEYLVMVHADNVRTAEKNAMTESRDILRGVMADGSEIAGEISADVSNACMDLVAFFA